MASIHRRFGSPYWVAAFTDATGRRRQVSTKERDRKNAFAIAQSFEKARGGILTEKQCLKILSSIREAVTGKPFIMDTVRSWLGKWLKDAEEHVNKETAHKYRRHIEEFISFMGSRADMPLAAVQPDDIKSFLRQEKAEGISGNSANQKLNTLRRPFRAAHELGLTDMFAAAGVKTYTDEADTERDVFTPEQVASLVEHAPSDDWRGAILCGYYTGLRLGSITELRWQNIDLDSARVTLMPSKTKRHKIKVMIPLHPAVLAWLNKQTRGIGNAPVFPSLVGKTLGNRSDLSQEFRAIMKRAGIKGRILRSGNGKGHTTFSLSFHSLRHTFNSALANADVPREVRQAMTGHTTEAMNERYTHRALETLRRAVLVLPEI
jgi:integrase